MIQLADMTGNCEWPIAQVAKDLSCSINTTVLLVNAEDLGMSPCQLSFSRMFSKLTTGIHYWNISNFLIIIPEECKKKTLFINKND